MYKNMIEFEVPPEQRWRLLTYILCTKHGTKQPDHCTFQVPLDRLCLWFPPSYLGPGRGGTSDIQTSLSQVTSYSSTGRIQDVPRPAKWQSLEHILGFPWSVFHSRTFLEHPREASRGTWYRWLISTLKSNGCTLSTSLNLQGSVPPPWRLNSFRLPVSRTSKNLHSWRRKRIS